MEAIDPFAVRQEFSRYIRGLNASQQSIQKVVSYCIKNGSLGLDIWECILEECETGSLNARINILYFLDSLCETSLSIGNTPYLSFATKDLVKFIDFVVPPHSREGILNFLSTKMILDTWRTKRIFPPELIDECLASIERRKKESSHDSFSVSESTSPSGKKRSFDSFTDKDRVRRMEEDRERHKRLRERIWVLPIPIISCNPITQPPRLAVSLPLATPPSSAEQPAASTSTLLPTFTNAEASGSGTVSSGNPSPASPPPFPTPISPPGRGSTIGKKKVGPTVVWKENKELIILEEERSTGVEVAIDLEFEQAWESTSDFNEDDFEEIKEETLRCFPNYEGKPLVKLLPTVKRLLQPSNLVSPASPPLSISHQPNPSLLAQISPQLPLPSHMQPQFPLYSTPSPQHPSAPSLKSLSPQTSYPQAAASPTMIRLPSFPPTTSPFRPPLPPQQQQQQQTYDDTPPRPPLVYQQQQEQHRLTQQQEQLQQVYSRAQFRPPLPRQGQAQQQQFQQQQYYQQYQQQPKGRW